MTQALFDSYTAPVYGSVSATSGVEDKSGRIDTSTLGQLAQGLDVGMNLGTQFHATKIRDEAESAANELVDMYKNDPNSVFNKNMADVNTSLVNSKSQGVFNTYEFQQRVLAKNSELASQNPGSRKEIAQYMNDIFDRTGVSKNLKVDEALFNKYLDKQNKFDEKMNTVLAEFGVVGEGLDYQTKLAKYHNLLQVKGAGNMFNAMTADNIKRNNLTGVAIINEVERSGGVSNYLLGAQNSINQQLYAILDNPDLNDQDRQRQLRDVFNTETTKLRSLTDVLAQNAEHPTAKQLISSINALNTSLEAQMTSDFKQEDLKTRIANDEAMLKHKHGVAFQEKYQGKDLDLGVMNKFLGTLSSSIKLLGNVPELTQAFVDTSEAASAITLDLASGVDFSFLNSNRGKKATNTLKSSMTTDEASTEVAGKLLSAELEAVKELPDGKKLLSLDSTLQAYERMDVDKINNLMSNNQTAFRSQFVSGMSRYRQLTADQIQSRYPNFKDQVLYDSTNGRLYSENQQLNADLGRINTFMNLYGKINNIDITKDFDKLLKGQFPMFNINTVTQFNNPKTQELLDIYK